MGSPDDTRRSTRRRLRSRLALADRLTSLGMMAAGVAHDLATPLTTVIANLEYARQAIVVATGAAEATGEAVCDALAGAQAEALDAISEALAGARHATTVVKDLRAFARPDDGTQAPLELRTPVARALRLVTPELRHRARVTTSFRDAPPVLGSERLLTQVFVDLLVNAGQAMASATCADNVVSIGIWGDDREAVAEIRDTGAGIPATVLPRIFEPFFTTKPPEIGTGLGLWICRSIVATHGGRIEVESAVGSGTRITVRLPAHAAGEAARGAPA